MSWIEWALFLSLFSVFILFTFVTFALFFQTPQNRKISLLSSLFFLFIAVFIAYHGIQRIEERIQEQTIEDLIKLQQEYRDKKFNKPKKEILHIFSVDRKI